jgi:hypothetical protein
MGASGANLPDNDSSHTVGDEDDRAILQKFSNLRYHHFMVILLPHDGRARELGRCTACLRSASDLRSKKPSVAQSSSLSSPVR